MKSVFLISISAIWLTFLQSSVLAQSDHWENRLISHHVVATLNLNVSRLCQTYKGSAAVENFENLLKDRELKLAEIDQFQGVILNDPLLGLGADNSSHAQLTFAQPTEFDAATVGKHSRYKLNSEKIKTWDAFLGDPQRKGNWGAIAANDRTLVFGVTRMLKSIVASQDIELPKEHVLANLRKQDVDICITLSGGEKIHDVFVDAWQTKQYKPLFMWVDHGLVYFDGQAETQLVAELFAEDEASAKDLESSLKDLVKPLIAYLERELKFKDDRIEGLSEIPESGRLRAAQRDRALTHTAIQALAALKISQDGVVVRITGADKSFKALPKIFVGGITRM